MDHGREWTLLAASLIALGAAALGLLFPVLAESASARPGARAAHPSSTRLRLAALGGFSALVLHAALDGFALATTDGLHGHGHGHDHGHELTLALLLHRVPEGAAAWWLFRAGGRAPAALALTGLALASVAGFLAAGSALPALDAVLVAVLQAFVGGMLLHVLFHHGRGHEHGHG